MITLKHMKEQEQGNALFLILIAVALFAALSYAVTQSGRGGGSVDKEQALILASQVTQYPAAVRTGVTRMIVTGTTAATLSFTSSISGASTQVFDPAGGGVVWQNPPANAQSSAVDWRYLDVTHATNGFYIENVGTDNNVSGRDVIQALNLVTSSVCQNINKGLGLSVTPANQGATAFNWTAAGTKGAANTLNASAAATVINAFACISNDNAGGGPFIYYHALLEQ